MIISRRSITFSYCLLFCLQIFFVELFAQNLPKTYVARKSLDALDIDGQAKETIWKKSEWSDDFIDIEGNKTPKYRTRIKMAWDDDFLYFLVKMDEPHIWGTLKQRDTVIFYNNDFEVFIDPDGDTHDYMEFEMNALNTVWDLWLTKPYRNRPKVIDGWDIGGLKTEVHINGTLNDPTDIDEGWTAEIAMPWKALLEAGGHNKIPVQEFWRINFSRVNWDFDLIDGRYSRKKDKSGKYLPEYNWVWSPQGVINMHEPEHWGYVFFSDPRAGEKVDFKIPEDDQIKWYLYELARKVWVAEKDTNPINEADLMKILKNKEVLGKEIIPQFERHGTGWNIWIQSPFSNKRLVVREDGKFESID